MAMSFEDKQNARRNGLNAAADRADERSNAAYKRADMSEGATGIPFGQPILVGHHSEGKHRRVIEKARKAMDTCVEESKRADDLRRRADAVGTGGISSDDPEAIHKIREQIEQAEKTQDQMKAANKIIRTWMKKGITHETTGAQFDAFAVDLSPILPDFTPEKIRELIKPSMGCVGFPSFRLTNNTANIARLKKRLVVLESAAQRQTKETAFGDKCRVIENAEANRVQFIFPGKPDAATREVMKENGFRWAPSENAWQRQLTNSGIYAARRVIAALALTAS